MNDLIEVTIQTFDQSFQSVKFMFESHYFHLDVIPKTPSLNQNYLHLDLSS